MTIDKRYQVFISSTFADLKDERAKVQQAIMELDCIPAGMEMFPAVDEEQFEFIKKVIDDCDYYVLIVGGRYGSLSGAGISYTEMEYEYAISKGIRVLAFLHGAPEKIPLEKSERNATSIEKLADFRTKVQTGRLVKYWQVTDELPAMVTSSLSRTIRTYPTVGWVRGSAAQDPHVYKELNDLRKENQELKEFMRQQAVVLGKPVNFAGLEDIVTLKGNGYPDFSLSSIEWSLDKSFGEIFSLIAGDLMPPMEEAVISQYIVSLLLPDIESKYNNNFSNTTLSGDSIRVLRFQFRALEIIGLQPEGHRIFWELTELGEQKMLRERAMKRAN